VKLTDIDQLIRVENEATQGDYTCHFGIYGKDLWEHVRLHGLLKTMHYASDDNRNKMLVMINNF
jgi:hypothetical protein